MPWSDHAHTSPSEIYRFHSAERESMQLIQPLRFPLLGPLLVPMQERFQGLKASARTLQRTLYSVLELHFRTVHPGKDAEMCVWLI